MKYVHFMHVKIIPVLFSLICVTINFIIFIWSIKNNVPQYLKCFFISQVFFYFVTENFGFQYLLKISSSVTYSFWICYGISNKDSDFGFNVFINCSNFNLWYTKTHIKILVNRVVFKFDTLILITIRAWAL